MATITFSPATRGCAVEPPSWHQRAADLNILVLGKQGPNVPLVIILTAWLDNLLIWPAVTTGLWQSA
jgi:hypothetical protein